MAISSEHATANTREHATTNASVNVELKLNNTIDLKSNNETGPTKLLQNLLQNVLQDLGSQRKIIAETERLRLCTPTLLDMLLNSFKCSHVSELISCLITEFGEDESAIREEINEILINQRDPKKLQWLYFIHVSPFGQVSFFLKEDNSYVGQCRFYPPCGEKLEFERGNYSGGNNGVPDGYAEMSIHFLDKFLGKGYGTEGLHKALNVIIKPAIGTKPLVYAGFDAKNQKPILHPAKNHFLGLSTVTGLCNMGSIKCSLKAGLIPRRLANAGSNMVNAGNAGYIDFTFPKPNKNNENLMQFIDAWIKETSSYKGLEDNSYVKTHNGMVSHGLVPELCILYHRLLRQYSIENFPPSNEQILSYLESLNALYQNEIYNALPDLSCDKSCVPQTNIKELVWYYFGEIEGRKLIENLPAVQHKEKVSNREKRSCIVS